MTQINSNKCSWKTLINETNAKIHAQLIKQIAQNCILMNVAL